MARVAMTGTAAAEPLRSRAQLEDAVMIARVAGRGGDRESVQAAERSYDKKTRQKERRAKEAASEAERAERPRAQLRENIQYVVAGLRTAAAQTRSQAGSKIGVEYFLPPERDDGFKAGEAMQTSRPTSASGENDDEDADRSEEYSDDGRVSD
ncbi:hypothetical protein EMIHUDRAFT_199845 [Emiliania huxleyi CCMP1516]|uniref:Uncharacterized protein n=2 Tax=Emiliania huxleyi TaxID=2903 RepID=A0A0D3KUH6_EMIH1|nr:hypothetical protein EMIHUDRAFT_199845 [Emiliania huxleyi CCMP1516]EOD39411.1 hypothetical protein EMIHUDRAFT_199845 [Emiliania huxleyi CCMP1516]|eukprot:XP_005791840.1 hypothetical protein EMIHUDRAFT_199845 [Emiliania huxleyi CCMP1516]